jgi:hypothetical protein
MEFWLGWSFLHIGLPWTAICGLHGQAVLGIPWNYFADVDPRLGGPRVSLVTLFGTRKLEDDWKMKMTLRNTWKRQTKPWKPHEDTTFWSVKDLQLPGTFH